MHKVPTLALCSRVSTLNVHTLKVKNPTTLAALVGKPLKLLHSLE